ncbi:hypothetical protein [Pseudalkalibacillus caeni]|nr:hypothetical protein [Pseudalkalibacillus caeni]
MSTGPSRIEIKMMEEKAKREQQNAAMARRVVKEATKNDYRSSH